MKGSRLKLQQGNFQSYTRNKIKIIHCGRCHWGTSKLKGVENLTGKGFEQHDIPLNFSLLVGGVGTG